MSKAKNLITSKTVEIAAPAEFVWDILVDLPGYGDWNPFTVAVESSLEVGDPVNLYIADPANPGQRFCVVEYLVAKEPGLLLSWEQRPSETSKDAARRDQYIEAVGADRCRYFTTDLFLGLNADRITEQFGDWVQHSFDALAEALKHHAEAKYAAQQGGQV